MSLEPGSRLGAYVVGERLGESGSGEQWAASEPGVDRRVLLTVIPLPADPIEREATREHLRRRVALEHPGLVPVYGAGESGDIVWLTTPAPAGRSLAEGGRIVDRGDTEVAAPARAALAALAAAGIAPTHVGAADLVVEGGRVLLAPADWDGGSDASAAEGDLGRAMSRHRPSPARVRRARVLGVVAVVLAVAAIVLGVVIARGDQAGEPEPDSRVARIAASIPLGARPTAGVAADATTVWVPTEAGLVRVDVRSDRVVGAPTAATAADPAAVGAWIGEGSVWTLGGGSPTTASTRLVRVDPTTARVTGSVALGEDGTLGRAVAVGEGAVWVAGGLSRAVPGPEVIRIDPRTLEQIGPPIPVRGSPGTIVPLDSDTAWVLDYQDGTATRLSVSRGATAPLQAGTSAQDGAIAGGRLWIADLAGTVAPFDPETGAVRGTPTRFDGAPAVLDATSNALWVGVVEGDDPSDPGTLYRLDPATGRALGDPLRFDSAGGGLAASDNAVWSVLPADRVLHRLAPTEPPPGPRSEPMAAATRALVAGPLQPGEWRAGDFAIPLSFGVEDGGWVVLDPEAELFFLRRLDDPDVSVVFIAPRGAFSGEGRIVPLRTPEQFVALLRENPELVTGPVVRRTIAGRPALGVSVRVRAEARTEPCGEVPCVPLFPTPGFLLPRESKRERLFALLHEGRVLVISETRPAGSSFAATRSVVDSIRLS